MIWSSLKKPFVVGLTRNFNKQAKFKANDAPKNLKHNFKAVAKNTEPNSIKPFKIPSQNNWKITLKYGRFSLLFTLTCFTSAPILLYERMRQEKNRQRITLMQTSLIPNKKSESRLELNKLWNSFGEIQKVCIGIIFVNTLVCLAWRLPQFQPILSRHFLLHPESGRLSQMVLSVFSHMSFFHLGANMLGLFSVSNTLTRVKCISNGEQFLAFYLSAGVFSSFISSVGKFFITGLKRPSLGASGAVIACFSLLALNYPKTRFYILPIPFPLEAQQVLGGLVLLDTIGTILKWVTVDHCCHLGGTLFGAAFNYLQNGILRYQLMIYKKYQSIREK